MPACAPHHFDTRLPMVQDCCTCHYAVSKMSWYRWWSLQHPTGSPFILILIALFGEKHKICRSLVLHDISSLGTYLQHVPGMEPCLLNVYVLNPSHRQFPRKASQRHHHTCHLRHEQRILVSWIYLPCIRSPIIGVGFRHAALHFPRALHCAQSISGTLRRAIWC
jgi:hypothetical protein